MALKLLRIIKMDYIGVDEVGRGCVAGPMVLCGVINNDLIQSDTELVDSKKISAFKRAKICKKYMSSAKFALAIVSNDLIDNFGISKAFEVALKKIQAQLGAEYTYIIDGRYKIDFAPSHRFEYKAEDKYRAVALASIIAKQFRDSYMNNLCPLLPQYHFSKHKGYGTIIHRKAILENGFSNWHRKSFNINLNV